MNNASTTDLASRPAPRLSWLDALLLRIDRLPGPAWSVYLAVGIALTLALYALLWASGALAFPSSSFSYTVLAVWSAASLAIFSYLNGVAAQTVAAFRPVTRLSDEEAQRLVWRLTRMPPVVAWLCLPVAAAWLAAIYAADPTFFALMTGRATADAALLLFGWVNAVSMLLGTVRALIILAVVARSHELIERVDLFSSRQLFAFSGLNVRVAIAIVGMTYLFFLAFPGTTDNPFTYVYIVIIGLPLALASFILPLTGIHNKMAVEKERLETDLHGRIEKVTGLIHEAADALPGHELEPGVVQARKELLGALMIEKEYIAKTRTWPWSPNTLRSLLAAVLLPLIIFVAQNLLERLLAL